MNTRHVDEFARSLAEMVPRRRVLCGLGGGALAVLLGHERAVAACKKSFKKCEKNKDCCSKLCKQGKCKVKYLSESCKATANCFSGVCSSGQCCLPEGSTCITDDSCCSGTCFCPPGGQTKFCVGPAD